MGSVTQAAGDSGANESAEAADHGDDGDAAGRSLAPEDTGGQRPEGTHEAEEADGSNREAAQRKRQRVRHSGPCKTKGTAEEAADHMPAPFAKAVARPADDHGDDGCGDVGEGGVAGDLAGAGNIGDLFRCCLGGMDDAVQD